MSNILLYFICVFIWGSTWYAITFQLGVVAPTVSVFYRFLLSAVFLFIYCLLRGKKLKFSRGDHIRLALQGLCMFCGSYIFTYTAESKISSGIVAVTFTLLVYFNMLGLRLVYKQKIQPRILLSGAIGILGVGLIFYNEMTKVGANPHGAEGLVYAVIATLISSIGNIIAAGIRKKALPVMESNAWSMLYGALATGFIALCMGMKFDFVFTPSYIFSLSYLAVFGSVVAFGAYITLIGTIGADRAAYTGILTPVIALIISSVFESFHWNILTVVGMLLCIYGNYLILSPKKK